MEYGDECDEVALNPILCPPHYHCRAGRVRYLIRSCDDNFMKIMIMIIIMMIMIMITTAEQGGYAIWSEEEYFTKSTQLLEINVALGLRHLIKNNFENLMILNKYLLGIFVSVISISGVWTLRIFQTQDQRLIKLVIPSQGIFRSTWVIWTGPGWAGGGQEGRRGKPGQPLLRKVNRT